MRPKLLRNRGDTIVEVMVVLAVLGLAISISYATANRSLLNARQAQENSYATELAQNQIEAMRAVASATPPSSMYTQSLNTPFCFNNFSFQTASCADPTRTYTITDTRTDQNTFQAKVSWTDVTGTGTDNVLLSYRVYQ